MPSRSRSTPGNGTADRKPVGRPPRIVSLRVSDNPYDEFVPSTWNDNLLKLEDATDVVRSLQRMFGDMNASHIYDLLDKVGDHAKTRLRGVKELAHFSLLPVVKISTLGHLHNVGDPYETGYADLLQVLLQRLSDVHGVVNYLSTMPCLGHDHIHLEDATRDYVRKLESSVPGDFVPFLAQPGFMYAGGSVNWTSWQVANSRYNRASVEFLLPGAYIVQLLLTHPHLLRRVNQFGLDFAADVFDCPDINDNKERRLGLSVGLLDPHTGERPAVGVGTVKASSVSAAAGSPTGLKPPFK